MNISRISNRLYGFYSLLLIALFFYLNLNNLLNFQNFNLIVGLVLLFSLVLISYFTMGMDLITYVIFCIELLVVPISIQFYSGRSYGLLGQNILELHYPQFIEYTFIYCYLFLLICILFDYKSCEDKVKKVEFRKYSNLNIIFNNTIAFSFAIVAFPRLSLTVSATQRFSMLLPGHAWNQLAIVALLFNLPYLNKKISVKVTYLFVILWFLLNGERADITGLVLGIALYSLWKYKTVIQKQSKSKKILLIPMVILFIFILNYIASIRNQDHITFAQSIANILVTPTTSDVSYIFNTVIDYFQKYSILNGTIFKTTLFSIIPFYDNNSLANLLSAIYPYPGGEPWLAQPLLDWGMVGLFISPFIDYLFFRFWILKDNSFFKIEYIALLCLIPRAVWYGMSYTFTTLIFFVPLMYLMNLLILKLIRK